MNDLLLALAHKLGLHVQATPSCVACPHVCSPDECGHWCEHDPTSVDPGFYRDINVRGEDVHAYCDCEQHVEQWARIFAPIERRYGRRLQ